jgi:hypothetical protein
VEEQAGDAPRPRHRGELVLEKEAETSDMYATVTEYESDGNGDDNGKR